MPEELVGMRALLDDMWECDFLPDPAPYFRGRLPSRNAQQHHEVVLTLLGATATNAAADGCTHLINSFPSVGIVIMVGTAAGIPNPLHPDRHVRLGDIVVGTHGIIDYDHVRTTTNGDKLRQQFPSPSPRLVRAADLLKADQLGGQRPWEQWLDPKQTPVLSGYGRPPDSSDVLFDTAGGRLRHPARNTSGHPRGFPKLHRGLIGSGNRSHGDATLRDQLAAEHGFLALEMEAAGIGNSSFLNGLEWFVVRGISDYGDGRRDEAWRRYASLAAAAYVRALLAKCSPLGTVSRF
jgi:nucleoside phosphorylase